MELMNGMDKKWQSELETSVIRALRQVDHYYLLFLYPRAIFVGSLFLFWRGSRVSFPRFFFLFPSEYQIQGKLFLLWVLTNCNLALHMAWIYFNFKTNRKLQINKRSTASLLEIQSWGGVGWAERNWVIYQSLAQLIPPINAGGCFWD